MDGVKKDGDNLEETRGSINCPESDSSAHCIDLGAISHSFIYTMDELGIGLG
ncbi:MAG: hypothetical protein NTZ97_04760 [Candidatus Moranbacteria bacterium]|nr:hypothetical protein [Candidatus Moranbacteria bacterium]